MATEVSTQRELQDQSIKARKHELFVDDAANAGPHKAFREYLRETPAAPLSKNVKLILWASAVPVALLFVAAMLTGKGSTAKAPVDMVVPVIVKRPPTPDKTHVARISHGSNPEATGPTSDNPPEAKPKPKSKGKGKGKGKGKKKNQPKVEVAKADEPEKDKAEEPSTTDEEKATRTASDDKDEKPKDEKPEDEKPKDDKAKSDKASSKSKASSKTAPTPPKPPRRTTSIFKKKKAPVFTYPKGEGKKEKKDEHKTEPEPLRPGLIEITPSESGPGAR